MGHNNPQHAAYSGDFRRQLAEGFAALSELACLTADAIGQDFSQAVRICADALRRGNKIMACGNGGSAAQASHFVAELVGHFDSMWMWQNAMCLSDAPTLTALMNDGSAYDVFSHQVRACGKEGDVLVALSTSGQSPNVLRALERAHFQDISIILVTGENRIGQHNFAECIIRVPSSDTQRIQELHLVVLHCLAQGIKDSLYGSVRDQQSRVAEPAT